MVFDILGFHFLVLNRALDVLRSPPAVVSFKMAVADCDQLVAPVADAGKAGLHFAPRAASKAALSTVIFL